MGWFWNRLSMTRFAGVAREFQKLRWPQGRLIDDRDNALMKQLLAFVLRGDSNVIDIGANQGGFIQDVVRLAPDGHHHAFEPLPDLAVKLTERFPQVTIHSTALSDKNEQADFFYQPDLDVVSSLYADHVKWAGRSEAETKKITVDVRRLDDVLDDNYCPDLMKIDVEGACLSVIRGAKQILTRHQPLLLLEYIPTDDAVCETTPQMYYDCIVDELDMVLFTLDGVGPLSIEQFIRIHAEGNTWNYFARRK